MNQQHNFQSDTFRELMEGITRNIPALMFFGIVITYIVTAALNVHIIPLPAYIAVPAAAMIQFGRFAVVFMDFLNPTGYRSKYPPVIATVATVVALVELGFSVQDIAEESAWSAARYWSVYLFGAMLIGFGYILELNFIAKGVEAYGMKTYKRNVSVEVTPQSRPINPQRNAQPALVTAEKKRPEIMQELRERQEAQQAPQQAPAQHEEPKTVVHTAFEGLEDEIKSMSPQERAVLLSVMIQRQRSTIRTNKQRIADKEKKGVSDTSTQVAAIQNAEAKINYYQSFL
jgi:hypothetical protein